MRNFLRRLFRSKASVRPGLYVYSVSQQPSIAPAGAEHLSDWPHEGAGGSGRRSRRFHLRVQPDGSGLLFVDLADPVHLNPPATLLVWHALEGRTAELAFQELRQRAPKAVWPELRQTVEGVFGWLKRLQNDGTCCVWDGLAEARAFGLDALGWAGSDSDGATHNQSAQAIPHHPLSAIPAVWAEPRPLFSLPVQAPFKADVVVQYGCNNRCGHCYNLPARRRQPPMSMQTWRQVVEKLAELGVPHLILTGGEPTLCDDLPERIHLAHQYGLVVGLNTNGRRLADPAFTARLAQAGLDHVQITLLSSRPEVHNSLCQASGSGSGHLGNPFAETVAGIQNTLKAGLYTLTNTTLTRHNAQEAETLVDFLYRLGIRTFAMNGIIRSGLGKQFPDALAEEELAPVLVRVRDRAAELAMRFLWYTPTRYCRFSPLELELGTRRCNAAQYSICIEPNGEVLPCQSYYQPVGNLLRDPWPAIWESPLFRRLRGRIEDPAGSGLPEPCWQCPDLPVCGGGCLLAFSETLGQNHEIWLSRNATGHVSKGKPASRSSSGWFRPSGPCEKEFL